jgi:hypothetical protein
VSEIRIYVEGGGDKDSKARLREAFSRFLTEPRLELQKRGFAWRVVMCGSREEAYEAFRRGTREHAGSAVLLLVDAEAPVAGTERQHLTAQDGWDLSFAKDESIHLMTEVMESWFVADVKALARFYGQGFAAASIPKRKDVEEIPKADVEKALKDASRNTKPGLYHKTRHAPKILESLDPAIVRARAPRCDRLFDHLLTTSAASA